MKAIIKIFLLLGILLNASFLFAQEKKAGISDTINIAGKKAVTVLTENNKPVEMADMMRSNGKIYIVVAVCFTILVGLFIYVWRVDRKVGRIEKEG